MRLSFKSVPVSIRLLQYLREKPPFDLLARPGRFPQKREADATPHLGPPMPLDQLADNGLQRDPVQRIPSHALPHPARSLRIT